jgi:hypothetical protein
MAARDGAAWASRMALPALDDADRARIVDATAAYR